MAKRALTKEVTVVVATYGDVSWVKKAIKASRSVDEQTIAVEAIYSHGDSLHQARNSGAALAKSEWLIFLDADDALDPGYVEAMLAGSGDLRQPATIGMYDNGTYDDEADRKSVV